MTIRQADFDKHAGETFTVHLETGDPTALTLKEIAPVKIAPKGHESFALIFDGPKEPYLEQKLYKVTHPQLGETAIFLVPVAGDDSGYDYEAVYNIKIED